MQKRSCWYVINLQPDLISFLQVERPLEGKRFVLSSGVIFFSISISNRIAVQIHWYNKTNSRWRCRKPGQSDEWKWINSIPRSRKYPRCRIHGPADVQYFHVKRHRRLYCVEFRISLNVEIDGRWFNVDVSDPRRLEACNKKKTSTFDLIEFCW